MSIVVRTVALVACLGAVSLLGACATTPATELALGKQSYHAMDYQRSFFEIKKAAFGGDPNAQYALGFMYYYGRGTDLDTASGKLWITRAAMQGQPRALRALRLLRQAEARRPKTRYPLFISGGVVQTMSPASLAALEHHATSKPRQASTQRGRYTLQLFGTYHEGRAIGFIRAQQLGKQATYRKHTRQGRDWYVVLYGRYPTHRAAERALKQLPAALRRLHPWVTRAP